MAVALTVAAYKTKLGNPVAKAVLVLLADAANNVGYCWPSTSYISEMTEVAVETVRRCVKAFAAIGLVERLTVEGKVYDKAFQINLDMLGTDLDEAYAVEHQRLHGNAVPGTAHEQAVPGTGKAVPGREKAVPGRKPPHPLKGGTVRNRKEPSREVESKTVPAQPKVTRENIFTFPPWVPAATWSEFKAMRERMRKPLTPGAVKLLVAKLERFKDAGQDVQAVLEQSIEGGWSGLYEVREEGRDGFNRNGKAAGEGGGLGRDRKFTENAQNLRAVLEGFERDRTGVGGDGVLPGGGSDAGVPGVVLAAVSHRVPAGGARQPRQAGGDGARGG
jgi:hypothetical protein